MKALDFRMAVVALVFVTILTAASGALANTLTLTGDIDTDFLGKPGVIIKDGTFFQPNYTNGGAPLAAFRPNGSRLIAEGTQVPSGFHVSRVAVNYDCKTDTVYVGFDVSNPTLDATPLPTGEISRAWDADGDGDPCTVTNSMLNDTGEIDTGLPGNDDIPTADRIELSEKYILFLKFGGLNVTLRTYDDGTSIADDAVSPNFLHKHYGNPCPESPIIHATLSAVNGGVISLPGKGVDFDVVYVNSGKANYDTHRDIEFVIKGLKNVVPAGTNLQTLCSMNLSTFTDSDYDASSEASLDWKTFDFVSTAAPVVTCEKSVDTPQLSSLPATVTYTLKATNESPDGTNENITIFDPDLGVDQTFTGVAKGQTKTVTVQKTFGAEFCGSAPFVNTMYVSAVPADCCSTGAATSSCSATVTPPPPANVSVSCTKVADKTKLCQLPDTVKYTITARNTSSTDTTVTMRVVDAKLGVDQTFTGVKPGDVKTIEVNKTFGTDFCGSDPYVNTVTVSATAEGWACGVTSATSACTATVNPPDLAKVKVSCTKVADAARLCTLPTTVTYTITAKNDSETDTPVKLCIIDPQLGVNQCFDNVVKGETKTLQVQKVFGTDFCGSDPFVNTVTVSATALGCVCGTTSATSSCTTTISSPEIAKVVVSCSKVADKTTLCRLPDTVTYTLTATNNSITETPVTLCIIDPALGINQCFTAVAKGQSRSLQVQKTFGTDFCGSDPFVNTMTASGAAEGCGCGTVTAISTCSASVAPPPTANVQITCLKTVDKPKLCRLPESVTYTLSATNVSPTNTPVTLVISDPILGVNQTFTGVAKGQTKTVTVQKTFGVDFCGSAPFLNTMTASAGAEGCVCGTLTAVSTCTTKVEAPDTVIPKVTCLKTVDKVKLCTLPDTVTYTLQATNDSETNTALTLRIVDTKLGVDQTFTGVAKGQTKTVTVQKTFGADFCGSAPFLNTMTVSGTVEGCGCGTLTATSSCSASVGPPDTVKVDVSCSKLVDKPSICELPATVVYQLSAMNTGDTTVSMQIYDAALGINQIFTGVKPGETKSVTAQKTFGVEFCGSDPIINTMQVSAVAEGGCVCGTTSATSACTATVTLPRTSLLTCSGLINGQEEIHLLKSDLPTTLHYQFQLCNTGQVSLDCELELPNVPSGTIFDTPGDADGKWRYTLAAGECKTILGEIFVTPDMVPCPGQIEWNTPMIITAEPSQGECACPVVMTDSCSPVVTIGCPGLSQAYPATSLGKDASFVGYQGRGGDVINAIGGIFSIVPGNKWSNFIKAARDGWAGGYTVKNIVLRKETPEFIQCNEVYKPRKVVQQGTVNIRTWWPLMYEAPGTQWTLTILYGTGQVRVGPNVNDVTNYDYDGTGPLPAATVHTDTWDWKVDADLSTLGRLLDLFHEIPFGMDEVPLISDEVLYPALKAKLAEVEAFVRTNNTAEAGLAFGEFELMVEDACISSSPVLPYPTNNGTGIAQSSENPACCKILIDVEYIAKKLGLFVTGK